MGHGLPDEVIGLVARQLAGGGSAWQSVAKACHQPVTEAAQPAKRWHQHQKRDGREYPVLLQVQDVRKGFVASKWPAINDQINAVFGLRLQHAELSDID